MSIINFFIKAKTILVLHKHRILIAVCLILYFYFSLGDFENKPVLLSVEKGEFCDDSPGVIPVVLRHKELMETLYLSPAPKPQSKILYIFASTDPEPDQHIETSGPIKVLSYFTVGEYKAYRKAFSGRLPNGLLFVPLVAIILFAAALFLVVNEVRNRLICYSLFFIIFFLFFGVPIRFGRKVDGDLPLRHRANPETITEQNRQAEPSFDKIEFTTFKECAEAIKELGFRGIEADKKLWLKKAFSNKKHVWGILAQATDNNQEIMRVSFKSDTPVLPLFIYDNPNTQLDIYTLTEHPVNIDKSVLAFARIMHSETVADDALVHKYFDPASKYTGGYKSFSYSGIDNLLWDECILVRFTAMMHYVEPDSIDVFNKPLIVDLSNDYKFTGLAGLVASVKKLFLYILLGIIGNLLFLRDQNTRNLCFYFIFMVLAMVIIYVQSIASVYFSEQHIYQTYEPYTLTERLKIDPKSEKWRGKNLKEVKAEIHKLEKEFHGYDALEYPETVLYDLVEGEQAVYVREYVLVGAKSVYTKTSKLGYGYLSDIQKESGNDKRENTNE